MEFNHRQYAALVESDKALGVNPEEGQSARYRNECEDFKQRQIKSQEDRRFLDSKQAPNRPNRTPDMVAKKVEEVKKIMAYLEKQGEDVSTMNFQTMIGIIDLKRASTFIDVIPESGDSDNSVTAPQTSDHDDTISDDDVVASYIALYGQEKFDNLVVRWQRDTDWLRKQIIKK